jgi:hypothetical protein
MSVGMARLIDADDVVPAALDQVVGHRGADDPAQPDDDDLRFFGKFSHGFDSALISLAISRLFARVRFVMISTKREDVRVSTPWATLLSCARRVLSRQGHLNHDIHRQSPIITRIPQAIAARHLPFLHGVPSARRAAPHLEFRGGR